ncbi:PsiF family protein [Paeniroseomonas aquatica]|uniref:PsiF family protein n=1 Tax=Paeniroseomonas aquatica TaxID=373043 RepID=A0ABT8A3D5_9PROT|nr:PsiF family protein [Paeniroseomonas aquatica]MDN3564270.1 PsiF family protein [Paeniroseomonas aquatica]
MRWIARLPLLALLLALPATAAERREPSPAQLAQQAKMRTCAAQARGQQLRGAPRRNFMKTCLSGRATTPA